MIDDTTAPQSDLTYRILATVSNETRISVPVEEIAADLDLAPRDLDDGIAEAIRAGWIEQWDHSKAGRCLTLTPRTAEAAGLRPDWRGKFWERAGAPPSRNASRGGFAGRMRCASDVYGEYAAYMLELAPDLDPEPSDAVPTHLIGLSVPCWTSERPEHKADCPACGPHRMTNRDYCLLCDRPMGTLAARRTAHVGRLTKARAEREKLRGGRASA